MASATYEQPDAEMLELLERTIEECHERLLDADVRVQLLVARGPTDGDGELVGPALKHHGIAALGITKINSLKHRVAGLGDAEIDPDRRGRLGRNERPQASCSARPRAHAH